MSTFSNFTGNIKIGGSVGAELDETPVGAGWAVIAGGALYRKNLYTVPANQYIKLESQMWVNSSSLVFMSIFSDAHIANLRAIGAGVGGGADVAAMKSAALNWVDSATAQGHQKDIILPSGTTLSILTSNGSARVLYGYYGQLFYNG